MAFKEYSEQRRQKVAAQEQDAIRINELAYRYIDEIFSCEAFAYASFRNFRLERDKEFNFRISAHEAIVLGFFEHVWVDGQFGGRWTFWLDRRAESGLVFQTAIFAIEFDQEGRIRYGTEGVWDARIQRNPRDPWRSRDRLISNVVAAIQGPIDAFASDKRSGIRRTTASDCLVDIRAADREQSSIVSIFDCPTFNCSSSQHSHRGASQ